MTSASLMLDDLELMDPDGIANGSSFGLEVLADGTSFGGGPASVVQSINSRLYDGSVVKYDHSENRELTFVVKVTGPDLAACAEGEAALVARLYRAADLVWTPPDGFGTPGRFEVWTSEPKYADNDLDMVRNQPSMTYTLSFTCAPWVTSLEPIVTEALPVPSGGGDGAPFTTILDECDSTTNWQPMSGASIGSAFSIINVSEAISGLSPVPVYVDRTGLSTVTAADQYFYVDLRTSINGSRRVAPVSIGVTYSGTAVGLSPIAVGTGRDDFRRYWFQVPVGTVTAVRVQAEFTKSFFDFGATATIEIDDLTWTNVPPFVGTQRQQARTIPIPGSVRTQSSIRVTSPTSGLGDVLVFSYSDDGSGYVPPLTPHRSGGQPVVSESARVSGRKQSLSTTAFTADIPIGRVPRGLTYLYALISSSSTGAKPLFWAVDTMRDGVSIHHQEGLISHTFGSDYEVVPVKRLVARQVAVKDNSDAMIRVTLFGDGLTLDEGWLFNADRDTGVSGALSWVRCGAAQLLSIEAPRTRDPYPRVFVGDDADDQTSWVHASADNIPCPGVHEVAPPSLSLFVVTTGATDASLSQEAYARAHTFMPAVA